MYILVSLLSFNNIVIGRPLFQCKVKQVLEYLFEHLVVLNVSHWNHSIKGTLPIITH